MAANTCRASPELKLSSLRMGPQSGTRCLTPRRYIHILVYVFIDPPPTTFLNQFFDGKLAPFLSTFVERKGLSDKELADLKQILDSMEPPEEETDHD